MQNLAHAHNARVTIDQHVKVARERILQRGRAIELGHELVGVDTALKVDGDAQARKVGLVADIGNLLDLAIKAAKARASLGEISSALEKHFGRHKAPIKLITGVYAQSYGQDPLVEEVRKMTDDFAERTGRRPRILVAKMGQDGHDRGAKVVSSAYADLGFDVDVGPLFQTPEETAKMAIENDVHMIGMSSLAAGHKVLLPALVEELARQGRPDILVFCGGVIPAQDYDFLKEHGAVAIFGPGTNIPEASREIMEALNEQYAD